MTLSPVVDSKQYEIRRLDEGSVEQFADFLENLRSRSWSLTSSAYQRKPSSVSRPDAEALLAAESDADRIGTFLLLRRGQVLGSVNLDYSQDRTSVVFSNAEADPAIQRRGVVAMCLLRPCFLAAMDLDVSTFQMTTWWFNRKAFPLYAKAGFRIVPGTSVTLISFLPALFRCYGHRFDGCPRRFLDHHLPGDIRGQVEPGTSEVVYGYGWRSGLRREVRVDHRTGSVRVVNPDESHPISATGS